MLSMKDKLIMITGASSGFGAAFAEVFAAAGARLLLCARRLEKLEKLAEHLRAEFSTDVLALPLDVTSRDGVLEYFAGLPSEWKDIDVLINNAGLALGKEKAQRADVTDWERMIDTNFKGLLYVTREVLPGMVNRGRGHVINIGSIAGHEAYQGGSVYCGSKFAVRGFTDAMRQDLLGTGVRVTAVDPGFAQTEFSLVRFKGDAEAVENTYRGMTPLSAADVAEAVYFCAVRPEHVTINELVIMPTDQASAAAIYRRES